jgi:hypothetical protein
MTPLESYRILDWAEQTSLWENYQLGQLTNTVLGVLPNLNTAPSLVLQTVFNMDAESAERLVKIRQSMPFYTLKTINQVVGNVNVAVDEFNRLNFFSSFYLRLTLWYEGAQRMRQVHLKLTSRADGLKPWQIEYSLELNLLPTYKEAFPTYVQTALLKPTLPAQTQ